MTYNMFGRTVSLTQPNWLIDIPLVRLAMLQGNSATRLWHLWTSV